MKNYLKSGKYIDWKQPDVLTKAGQLPEEFKSKEEIVKACFLFVRDEIKHSWDYKMNPVTCKAPDVLNYDTSYCFAKGHLLTALLRANNIPAGLCYQRLTISDNRPPFCLHGLNAIRMVPRIDARGNKEGIQAEFCPPEEKLAFPIITEGEADLPEIWAEPLPVVVEALEQSEDHLNVAENLLDVPLVHIGSSATELARNI